MGNIFPGVWRYLALDDFDGDGLPDLMLAPLSLELGRSNILIVSWNGQGLVKTTVPTCVPGLPDKRCSH